VPLWGARREWEKRGGQEERERERERGSCRTRVIFALTHCKSRFPLLFFFVDRWKGFPQSQEKERESVMRRHFEVKRELDKKIVEVLDCFIIIINLD
jgi:hypothetical protein